MSLRSRDWRTSYRHEDGDLVRMFFVPALSAASRYDRMTGYFTAKTLALAARGIDALIHNSGRMRLVVGCTLDPAECAAMEVGYANRPGSKDPIESAVARKLAGIELVPPTEDARDALGALAFLIANNFLDVKVAVPVDPATGAPASAPGIYHEKAGVIADGEGNLLSFSGSINETESGWLNNRESFHVHCSWEGERESKHVQDEVRGFERLWEGRAVGIRTVEFPEAAKERLLAFLPTDDRFVAPPKPVALAKPEPDAATEHPIPTGPASPPLGPPLTPPLAPPAAPLDATSLPPMPNELRDAVWTFLRNAAGLPNGVRVGEATSAVTPWPHQLRAFERMWNAWPFRMLESSEVGLGKTTIAGMLLRQLWLSGRVKRALILVPAGVIPQWVAELYEKFGLHVPVYDGEALIRRCVPGYVGPEKKLVGRRDWMDEPLVIASSHLVRRSDRAKELLACEAGWDLVILDEAHHARRKGAGSTREKGPNALLALMRELEKKTRGLLLLTATPMQVHPVEVWDLLNLLGMPVSWPSPEFCRYFEVAAKPNPTKDELKWLAEMFRATEQAFGAFSEDEIKELTPEATDLRRRKALKALRDGKSGIKLGQLDADERALATKILRACSPVRARMSRHTRALLAKYFKAGLIQSSVAKRNVRDLYLDMSKNERELYEAMEEYVASTYAAAEKAEKNAIGFILTVFRRRLASSVQALKATLRRRLGNLGPGAGSEEDEESQDELGDELLSPEEARALEAEGLARVEAADIKELLKRAERVGPETKAKRLVEELRGLLEAGHDSAILFTQYTDTMNWLAEFLAQELPEHPVGTYSGAGGRIRGIGGDWSSCSKEDVKLALKHGRIRLLVATDAAGEGLNLQFCGVVVNYDLPWNPMKVEQRIGRIDRIGQKHPEIVVLNLGYKGTVEADVYAALGERINLFEGVVGRLQPILSRLPGRIEQAALQSREEREAFRERFKSELEDEVREAETAAFDIDEGTEAMLAPPDLPASPLRPEHLEWVLRTSAALPAGWAARGLDPGSFSVRGPGYEPLRATPLPNLFDEHPESMAFFTPGSPLMEAMARDAGVGGGGGESAGRGVAERELGDFDELVRVLGGTK